MPKKLIKMIAFVLSLVLLLAQLISCTSDNKNKSQKSASSSVIKTSSDNTIVENYFPNSLENIYFGQGLIAECGDYTYSIVGPGRFFGIKKGEVTAKRFLTGEMQEGYDYSYLNVIGDWIYYLNKTTNTLCKVKTDRTGQTTIGSNVLLYIINKSWIYFISLDDFSIYKMKIDGSQKKLVVDGSDNHIINMIIDNDLIYFNQNINENGKSQNYGVFVNTDGSNLQKSNFPVNGFLSQDWIYYTEYNAKAMINILYRQNIKTEEKEILVKDGVYIYLKQGNYIYYIPANSHTSSGHDIYELNLNTKASRLVMKTSVAGLSNINCTQEYIFLSGSAFESHYTDMVRIPIDAQSDKSGEERFVIDNFQWKSISLDPKYR